MDSVRLAARSAQYRVRLCVRACVGVCVCDRRGRDVDVFSEFNEVSKLRIATGYTIQYDSNLAFGSGAKV